MLPTPRHTLFCFGEKEVSRAVSTYIECGNIGVSHSFADLGPQVRHAAFTMCPPSTEVSKVGAADLCVLAAAQDLQGT